MAFPRKRPTEMPARPEGTAADGYIFVMQNLRGRFKSEGVFKLSSQVDLNDPKATNETTDAYDTIDWLVKNVPNNKGNVGIYGVSYDGLTAGLTLLHPHPALKAISEQAAPVDQWMNDDIIATARCARATPSSTPSWSRPTKTRTRISTSTPTIPIEWYLNLGPLRINAKYLHGSIPFWNDIVAHPNYDEFWKKEAWVNQLHSSTCRTSTWPDSGIRKTPGVPGRSFAMPAEHDPDHTNFIVAGPWFHGEWQSPKATRIGIVPFGGHETAREFRENIQAPFFRYYLHGDGEQADWQATTFQTGSNTWHTYAPGRRQRGADNLYLHADGTLVVRRAACRAKRDIAQYVSDPANPVPYRTRPISPTYPAGDWRDLGGRPISASSIIGPTS